jgi:hypothetical protein
LFSVRTPTATVTDLGTEFGVYVTPAGSCQTFVFQGEVEVQPMNGIEEHGQKIRLGKNEFAQTNPHENNSITVTKKPGMTAATKFMRQMPKQVRIELYNTGINLRQGDADPHWQLYARSDDLNFKPRPAVVSMVNEQFALANDPRRSQWISAVADLSPLPDNVVYTFRTTFELRDVSPETAIIRGRFLADDHVVAIRLNGRSVKVPDHPWGWPFDRWADFKASDGFLEGINVLEVDLLNQDPAADASNKSAEGAMALRVELSGVALTVPVSGMNDMSNSATREGKSAPARKPESNRGGKEVER